MVWSIIKSPHIHVNQNSKIELVDQILVGKVILVCSAIGQIGQWTLLRQESWISKEGINFKLENDTWPNFDATIRKIHQIEYSRFYSIWICIANRNVKMRSNWWVYLRSNSRYLDLRNKISIIHAFLYQSASSFHFTALEINISEDQRILWWISRLIGDWIWNGNTKNIV